MKKIDLHIHTHQTPSDPPFTYSFDVLKDYVERAELDCIAITNHNTFIKSQFETIKSSLDILVLPGIEVDLGIGHILVISNGEDLNTFEGKCRLVQSDIPDKDSSIDLDRFKEIFGDLSKYILIPHSDKNPSLHHSILEELRPFIDAGEVGSIKKFLYAYKNPEKLPPVLFSDMRAKSGLKNIPTKATFVDVQELNFGSLKDALNTRGRLSLTKEEGNEFFQVLDDGLKLSTGLNVILGQRSTGKSYTLDKICSTAEFDDIKYIRQFELLERSGEDENKFEEHIKKKRDLYKQSYLKEFKEVVDEVIHYDFTFTEKKVEKYLDSLKQFAFNRDREDVYSSSAMFSETEFEVQNLSALSKLIEATKELMDSSKYEPIISKHISHQNLINMYMELINRHCDDEAHNRKKQKANSIVNDIKSKLGVQTATNQIEDINFKDIAKEKDCIQKFNDLVELVRTPKEKDLDSLHGYNVVAKVGVFKTTSEVKNESNQRQGSFQRAFSKYYSPFQYLCELKEIDALSQSDYYNFFAKISYEVQNSYGSRVSGGERSEFRLLESIKEAQKFDILLIDEPESSFDNVFLLTKVNALLRDISKTMPVVVVTHNNTVGASIEPNYIVYTCKNLVDGNLEYKLYSGYPTDTELVSVDGDTIPNHSVTLNCLEAGFTPYDKRREKYEALQD